MATGELAGRLGSREGAIVVLEHRQVLALSSTWPWRQPRWLDWMREARVAAAGMVVPLAGHGWPVITPIDRRWLEAMRHGRGHDERID